MDYAQEATALASVAEAKPLEEITGLADDLRRMNASLDSYLSRFNGPTPAQHAGSKDAVTAPPTCYRAEIDRLRSTIFETGQLVDAINRLG